MAERTKEEIEVERKEAQEVYDRAVDIINGTVSTASRGNVPPKGGYPDRDVIAAQTVVLAATMNELISRMPQMAVLPVPASEFEPPGEVPTHGGSGEGKS